MSREQFSCGPKIGSGSFGLVYRGTNNKSGEEVAIKLEPVKARHQLLSKEAELYSILKGGVGVPQIHMYNVDCDFHAMVMELLGPSLEDLFQSCNRQFSLKTVVMLADQMIDRIAYLHSKNFIHRDIKPENFCIGLGEKANQVHLIDFGLAKCYRDRTTKKHIPYREKRGPLPMIGTARYVGVNVHLGAEPSRRDDLEAIGYVLMYFLLGSLPWDGLVVDSLKETFEKQMEKKMLMSAEVLGKHFQQELVDCLNYCRRLRFKDRPNYQYLRRLLGGLFSRQGYEWDFVWDWTIKDHQSDLQRRIVELHIDEDEDELKEMFIALERELSVCSREQHAAHSITGSGDWPVAPQHADGDASIQVGQV